MDFKEFKKRYPPIVKFPNLTGEFHLLIYEDPSDRNHAILARSFEATKKLYAKLARKWNYVPELHEYRKIKIVKPSAKIMNKLSKEAYQRDVRNFVVHCTVTADQLFQETGELAPGFAQCNYALDPDTDPIDVPWYTKSHLNCLNCDKRELSGGIATYGSHGIYPIDPEALVRDRWDTVIALKEVGHYFDHLKKALPIKADECISGPLFCVNADFGHHNKGVTLNQATLKNPTGSSGEVLFYYQPAINLIAPLTHKDAIPKDLSDIYEAEVASRERDLVKEKKQNDARRAAEKQESIRHYREVLGIAPSLPSKK